MWGVSRLGGGEVLQGPCTHTDTHTHVWGEGPGSQFELTRLSP